MSGSQYGTAAELGEGLRRGDPEAATAFVDRYFPRICAALRRVMYAREGCEPRDLEDVALETAERLVRQLGTEPVTNLGSYVQSAAIRAGLDWRKAHAREFELEGGGEAADFSFEDLDDDARADEEIRGASYVPLSPEAMSILGAALEKLTPQQRQLLDLRTQGYRYDEIALMLRDDEKPVRQDTWRQRHKRALALLEEECRRLCAGNTELLEALEETARRRKSSKKRSKRTS